MEHSDPRYNLVHWKPHWDVLNKKSVHHNVMPGGGKRTGDTEKKYLTCKRVKFHFMRDEDIFFRWLATIECIQKVEAAGDEIYLDLVDKALSDEDLQDLIGIFYRYDLDMKQLAQFLTPENEKWFYDNPQAFWHRRVFGSSKNKE